jgi:regulator of sirC expression with transglutaminase-like and TPR domain
VALGVLFLTAGRACGLDVAGADFPPHFLLRLESDEGRWRSTPSPAAASVFPSELVRRACTPACRRGRRTTWSG